MLLVTNNQQFQSPKGREKMGQRRPDNGCKRRNRYFAIGEKSGQQQKKAAKRQGYPTSWQKNYPYNVALYYSNSYRLYKHSRSRRQPDFSSRTFLLPDISQLFPHFYQLRLWKSRGCVLSLWVLLLNLFLIHVNISKKATKRQ